MLVGIPLAVFRATYRIDRVVVPLVYGLLVGVPFGHMYVVDNRTFIGPSPPTGLDVCIPIMVWAGVMSAFCVCAYLAQKSLCPRLRCARLLARWPLESNSLPAGAWLSPEDRSGCPSEKA